MTQKYKDWGTWWDGLRTASLKAGATSIVTNLSVLVTTNTVSSLNIPYIQNVGENWKTFCIGLLFQFMLHTVYAAAKYVMDKPDADVVTVTTETTISQKTTTQNP
ncbi:MAG: hypothetical protein KGL39_25420 [Patescibacteria group bacterium]|nr:hypothetical protein [Patescibacteria group bacterium]